MDAAAELHHWRTVGRRIVHEADTKQLLAQAHVPVPRRNPGEGCCVVKLASDRFPHKTDHGLVRLNVQVEEAAAVAAGMRVHDPQGEPLIEEMVRDGVCEWIVGCRHDPTFGPIVVVGAGGVLVELLDAAKVRLAPTDDRAARTAILRQKSVKLLNGLRGKPKADIDALVDLVVRLSRFFAQHAEAIDEIEINPVIVLPEGRGAVAVDALMILRELQPQDGRPL
jgi:succinyl-CoA synthetase beta subunit